MRNKRHLFFILILFLIISSVSFVCASENVTHNGNTKEIATLSFSDDSADEDVTDVHLDSVKKSSNSALGLAGDAQNTNDTGNDSCLTDKSQILRASNDGRIDEKGILTVKNAQLLHTEAVTHLRSNSYSNIQQVCSAFCTKFCLVKI